MIKWDFGQISKSQVHNEASIIYHMPLCNIVWLYHMLYDPKIFNQGSNGLQFGTISLFFIENTMEFLIKELKILL